MHHSNGAAHSNQPNQEITRALAAPFPADVIGWKPGAVSGNRALALAYIDARDVMDRLDAVLGPDGWEDNYKVLTDGSVICQLRLRIGEHWVTKMDAGAPSEQPEPGDRLKAAVSDALKRTAVKFGIGRYLYRLPAQWVDWDPAKKQFVRTPKLPSWAIPQTTDPVAFCQTVEHWTACLEKIGGELQTFNRQAAELAHVAGEPLRRKLWNLVSEHATAHHWTWDAGARIFRPVAE